MDITNILKGIVGSIIYGAGLLIGVSPAKSGATDNLSNLLKGVGNEFLADVAELRVESFSEALRQRHINKVVADRMRAAFAEQPENLSIILKDIVRSNQKSPATTAPAKPVKIKRHTVAVLSKIWLWQMDPDNLKNACAKSLEFCQATQPQQDAILSLLRDACSDFLEQSYQSLNTDSRVMASVIIQAIGSRLDTLGNQIEEFTNKHPYPATDRLPRLDQAEVQQSILDVCLLKCPHCGNSIGDRFRKLNETSYQCLNCDRVFFCLPRRDEEIEAMSRRIACDLESYSRELIDCVQREHQTTRAEIQKEGQATRSFLAS